MDGSWILPAAVYLQSADFGRQTQSLFSFGSNSGLDCLNPSWGWWFKDKLRLVDTHIRAARCPLIPTVNIDLCLFQHLYLQDIYRTLNTLFLTNNPALRSLLRTIDVSIVTKLLDYERSALIASRYDWKSYFQSWTFIYLSYQSEVPTHFLMCRSCWKSLIKSSHIAYLVLYENNSIYTIQFEKLNANPSSYSSTLTNRGHWGLTVRSQSSTLTSVTADAAGQRQGWGGRLRLTIAALRECAVLW